MTGCRFKTYAYPAEVGGGRAPPHGEVGFWLILNSKSDLAQSKLFVTSVATYMYMYRLKVSGHRRVEYKIGPHHNRKIAPM